MEKQESNGSKLRIDQLWPGNTLAESLGISKGSLDSWRRKYGLPFVRLGARIFYLEPDFMMWVASRRERLGLESDEEATL